jgi:hypothetical protein
MMFLMQTQLNDGNLLNHELKRYVSGIVNVCIIVRLGHVGEIFARLRYAVARTC